MNKPLGKLERVALREQWKDEAVDFTPWLATEEGLGLLGETIGWDLELVRTEHPVGEFSADILAKDTVSGKPVIVENQLERTDHDHLGKLITYASGLGAAAIVWVAPEIREPHRQAIKWLNDAPDESTNFFALEIELWRIGTSDPAPKFNIVCQPNEWGRGVKALIQSGNAQQAKWVEFWTRFNEFCRDKGTPLPLRAPTREGTYSFSVGRANFSIALTFRPALQRIGCELFIMPKVSGPAFEQFNKEKASIEAELGGSVQWDEPSEGVPRGRIVQYRSADFDSRDMWPEFFGWLKERAEAFHKVFAPRVKALKLETPEEE